MGAKVKSQFIKREKSVVDQNNKEEEKKSKVAE